MADETYVLVGVYPTLEHTATSPVPSTPLSSYVAPSLTESSNEGVLGASTELRRLDPVDGIILDHLSDTLANTAPVSHTLEELEKLLVRKHSGTTVTKDESTSSLESLKGLILDAEVSIQAWMVLEGAVEHMEAVLCGERQERGVEKILRNSLRGVKRLDDEVRRLRVKNGTGDASEAETERFSLYESRLATTSEEGTTAEGSNAEDSEAEPGAGSDRSEAR